MAEKITNHVERVLGLEISQFKGQPDTTAVLTAIADEVQAIEDMLFDVILGRWIDTATGAQLDVLGKVVGLARDGRTDEQYRDAIRVQATLNVAGGEVETIIQAILFFSGADSVEVLELVSTAIQVAVEYPVSNGQGIADVVRNVKAAGVDLVGVIEHGALPANADYTVADETERLTLTVPPLVARDTVHQVDTGDVWEFDGGDPSSGGSWTLVGPPFAFAEDSEGAGLADLSEAGLPGAGLLSELVGT